MSADFQDSLASMGDKPLSTSTMIRFSNAYKGDYATTFKMK